MRLCQEFLFLVLKAAPGYALAKCIIRAINKVAERINHDPRIKINDQSVVFPEELSNDAWPRRLYQRRIYLSRFQLRVKRHRVQGI